MPIHQAILTTNKKKRKVKFPCKLCNDFHLTHFCPKLDKAKRLLDQKNATQQTIILSNPFPHLNQKMVASVGYQSTLQGGNHTIPAQGDGPSTTDPTIYMMEADVSIQSHSKNYDASRNEPKGKDPLATSANSL